MSTTAKCAAHKVFERDTFARTPRAEVWCQQPTGHGGAHEATVARMSYCWSDKARQEALVDDLTTAEWRRFWPSLDTPLTVAERGCRGAGFCVFIVAADRCTICHRTRDGKRD